MLNLNPLQFGVEPGTPSTERTLASAESTNPVQYYSSEFGIDSSVSTLSSTREVVSVS